jgi:hypothetical protein
MNSLSLQKSVGDAVVPSTSKHWLSCEFCRPIQENNPSNDVSE